jgi:hypothetical protein
MNEKLEYLLKTKAYSELTEVELREFAGLCDSREEYENMQLFFSQLDKYKADQSYETHYMTKGSLDEIFEKKNNKPGLLVKLFPPHKPIYLSPIIQIAALVVIVFLIFQYVSMDTVIKPQIAGVEEPPVKNKPNVEKKSEETKIKPTAEKKAAKEMNKNSVVPRNNEPQKNDNQSENKSINDETTAATNSGHNSGNSTAYSTTTNDNSSTQTNYFSATPTYTASSPAVAKGNVTMQSRTAYREEEDLEETKNVKNKKSNSTVQPKLFDLLTAVY